VADRSVDHTGAGLGAPQLRAGLEAFLTAEVGCAVEVSDLALVSSVGNAREPWSFTATWPGSRERCVLLAKAAAGQLETALRPEFATIAALAGTGVPVPRALWLDESGRWIGRAFFVTAWCPGSAETRSLRRPEPQAWARQAAIELASAAARLHQVPVDGFDWLAPCTVEDAAAVQLASWRAVFERQRLEPHPALVYAFAWLEARLPRAARISVVHGDLRFGNLLADDGHVTALLDWEMVHLGDPVEDLGWVYRALWTPERSLPFEDFLAAYGAAGGAVPEPEHLRWYQVFGEVKHSVISLTAARSFADGATTSLRHADRAATVPAFMRRLWELVSSC
jgi:aminoglycoside phosphotransferase (APT) family kinase protein